jgi:hypothetical protein
MAEIAELIGKTLTEIVGSVGDEQITFVADDGTSWRMYHGQDCCESVTVEDIAGDLSDLIGSPILQAEEATSNENPPGVKPEYHESFTWTFYKLATAKGYVTVRWYGQSNGYYSESVNFERVPGVMG